MSENINHIKTDKNCKKQGKTPKYVGENLTLKSRPNNSERPIDALAVNGKSLTYGQLEFKRCQRI